MIARPGAPVAEWVPARRKTAFPFGIAREDPLVPAGDEWWRPMSEAEPDNRIEGRPKL